MIKNAAEEVKKNWPTIRRVPKEINKVLKHNKEKRERGSDEDRAPIVSRSSNDFAAIGLHEKFTQF